MKNEDEFKDSVYNELIMNVNLNKFLTQEELDNINEFKISDEEADKIVEINKMNKNLVGLDRIKVARRISKRKKEFNDYFNSVKKQEELKNIPYYEVFNILWKQYNDTKKIYINSLVHYKKFY